MQTFRIEIIVLILKSKKMQTLQIQLGFSFFSELPVIQGANFAADCTSRFTSSKCPQTIIIKQIL